MSNENIKGKIYEGASVKGKANVQVVYREPPILGGGGRNPVLIKEVAKEVKLSETNFPTTVPTTSSKKIYNGGEAIIENVDLDNYDYVSISETKIEPVYTQVPPFNTSYIIKKMQRAVSDFYKAKKGNITISAESNMPYSKSFGISHKANTETILISGVSGFEISNAFNGVISNDKQVRIYYPNIEIKTKAESMTAEAFDLVDIEKTKIVYTIKLYQVDKYTATSGYEKQHMVDWCFE